MSTRTLRYACAAALAVLAVRIGISQTTQPATAPTTQPVLPGQPEALAELATKAMEVPGVHAAGRWTLVVPPREGAAAKKEVFGFEVWAAPPKMKVVLDVPSKRTRVSDGQFVYTYARPPYRPAGAPGQVVARRRAVAESNVYHAAGLAGPILDAATGYASLTRWIRFVPIAEPAGYTKAFPGLKWFRLAPVTRRKHHLLQGTTRVAVALSPADGLMRVLIAELVDEKRPPATSSVFFDKLTVRAIKAEEMKLPPEAAEARWTDTDQEKPIAAPVEIIAPKAP